MSKPVITFVFKVLRNGLLRYTLYACPNLRLRSCSKGYGMDNSGAWLYSMSKPVIAFVFQVPKLLHVDFSLSFMFEITRTRCYVMSTIITSMCTHGTLAVKRQVHIRFNNSKGTFINNIWAFFLAGEIGGSFHARCVLLEKDKGIREQSAASRRLYITVTMWTLKNWENVRKVNPRTLAGFLRGTFSPENTKTQEKWTRGTHPAPISVLTVYILDIRTPYLHWGATCEQQCARTGGPKEQEEKEGRTRRTQRQPQQATKTSNNKN